MLFCFSPVSFTEIFAAASFSYRGDVNEDGRVDIFDLLETLKILSHKVEPSEKTGRIADIDTNGLVDIFDLLGLLKVLSGKEQPDTIFWGPVIDSLSDRVVDVGDTVAVYVDNMEETVTPENIKVFLADNEITFFDFSLEKLLIIVPEGFKAGELKLLVDTDTTNSLYIIKTGNVPGLSMASVAGGTFVMGVNSVELDEKPAHSVTVDSFEISRTEITNAQYSEYLNAALSVGAITVTGDSVIGTYGEYAGLTYLEFSKGFFSSDSTVLDSINRCWIDYDGSRFSVLGDKNAWPVVFVTWYGASAFASHYGMRLPTEAEWEYVAGGGMDDFIYPTDDGTIDTDRANYGLIVGSPVDVASYPLNPFDLFDLAGNVSEWCSDWYDLKYYTNSPEYNPAGPETGTMKTARGCGWQPCDLSCRKTKRSPHDPSYRISYLGFRVARD
jgi:formylglycine-generating enzyme required for sulfatase activity